MSGWMGGITTVTTQSMIGFMTPQILLHYNGDNYNSSHCSHENFMSNLKIYYIKTESTL